MAIKITIELEGKKEHLQPTLFATVVENEDADWMKLVAAFIRGLRGFGYVIDESDTLEIKQNEF
jgi:hypothetical protein